MTTITSVLEPVVVNVVVDANPRLGPLSYRSPRQLPPGSAVEVPFGRRVSEGVVVGPGDPSKATRDILSVLAPRFTEHAVRVAERVADRYAADTALILAKMTTGDAAPADAGPLEPTVEPSQTPAGGRVLLCPPLTDTCATAAAEAAGLAHATGQVLVLVPTAAHGRRVAANFASGALESGKPGAAAGFAAGTVKVLIATRTFALAAPLEAAVVVVEEDHPGHLDPKSPHWNARDVAIDRSRALGAPVSLVTANASAQALASGLPVVQVADRSGWARLSVFDKRAGDPRALLPEQVVAAVAAGRRRGHDVIVSIPRPASLRCRSCSAARPCSEGCEPSACGHRPQEGCPQCGDTQLIAVGVDSNRLTPVLGPGTRLVVGAEIFTTKQAKRPATVVLADFDSFFASADSEPERRATSAVVAAQRIAGLEGQVVVVTADPAQPLLRAALQRQDLLELARGTWRNAKSRELPPFTTLVRVESKRSPMPDVAGWPGQVFGPSARGNGWELLVRMQDPAQMSELRPYLLDLRRGRGSVTVEVR